jgi:Family of unknown function (DUF6463)
MILNWLPRLIAGLGVIHLGYVVAESPGVVRDMLADGFVGASDDYRRDFVTWFFIGGLVLLMIAATARWAIRTTGRFPRPLAVGMLAIGVFDTLLEPDGGGYALVLLGGLATYAAYRSSAGAGEVALQGRPEPGDHLVG